MSKTPSKAKDPFPDRPQFELKKPLLNLQPGTIFKTEGKQGHKYRPEGGLFPIIHIDQIEDNPDWFERLPWLPESWDEYMASLDKERLDWLEFVLKELDDQKANLLKVIYLRECWRAGWTPDWTNPDQIKGVIERRGDEYYISIERHRYNILAFDSQQKAESFLNKFAHLIRGANNYI